MEKRSILFLAVCLLAFCRALPAQAIPGVAVPNGGYAQTCHVISYNAPTSLLSANCRTAEGGWITGPALDVSKCDPRNDIQNIEGILNCWATPGTWGFGGAIPGGDYRLSCHNMTILAPNGYNTPPFTLQANCERTRTNHSGPFGVFSSSTTDWPLTTLDLSNCQMGQRIWNQGGQLQCMAVVHPAMRGQQHQVHRPPMPPTPPGHLPR